jgi:hypothetical protein
MSVSKSATRAAASSVCGGEGNLRPFEGSPEGGLPAPEAATFAPVEDLLGLGAASFTAGAGLLLLGTADFTPPAPSSPHRKDPRS